MNRIDTGLLIGGPGDGVRVQIAPGVKYFRLTEPPKWEPSDFMKEVVSGPHPKQHLYSPEVIRGQDTEFVVYLHDNMSVDDAFIQLFLKYATKEVKP